jgi:hypothetical protein
MRNVFLTPFLAAILLAQGQPRQAPPPDDPVLFRYFFEAQSDPGKAQASANASINAKESPKLAVILQSVAKDLRTLDQQRQAYLDIMLKRQQRPNPATLQAFESRKYLLSAGGTNQIRRGVSHQGWQELRAHVNGPFRAALVSR